MNKPDKSSLSYKIQKNPFILGLFIVVLVVALVVIFTLSSAIGKKAKQLSATQPSTTQGSAATTLGEPENVVKLDNVKRRINTVKNVTCDYDTDYVKVTVTFKDKKALLDAHYASNDYTFNVYPEFRFYINNGSEVICPGQLKVVDDVTAEYYLYEISDLANAAALTDKVTLNYENLLVSLRFNIYLKHNVNDGVGRTVVGTYADTVEEFKAKYGKAPLTVSNVATGVKNAEIVVTDEFVWLDIYFTDEKAYNKLNHDFENNFVCFGFEKGGFNYDWKFISTEYDDLMMIRCKFDSYALTQFNTDIEGDDLSMNELFDYTINVWTSDYDSETSLLTIN
ncbi:MAG: hypothetical protein E7533_07675 [Ruminococcaceae bacterium]|nr:hypothetical protein [Oscillospiraceae bacterium]